MKECDDKLSNLIKKLMTIGFGEYQKLNIKVYMLLAYIVECVILKVKIAVVGLG